MGLSQKGLLDAGDNVVLVEQGIAGAKTRGLEHVICATTQTAGFREHVLPAIGLVDVIEHILDDLGVPRSVEKLMKVGGRIYATVPAGPRLWSGADDAAGHFRGYTLTSLQSVFQSAGFEVEFLSCFFAFYRQVYS